MTRIEKSIEVEVPIDAAYNQWTQFEEFPRFMEGIQEVHQVDDAHLTWVARVGGERKEWSARITRQVPDQVIAWESEGGFPNAGIVTFHRLGAVRTEVIVQMDYKPEDLKEAAGDRLGLVSRRVQGDLKRFKEFIEERGSETGAWRGKIDPEPSQSSEPDSWSGTYSPTDARTGPTEAASLRRETAGGTPSKVPHGPGDIPPSGGTNYGDSSDRPSR